MTPQPRPFDLPRYIAARFIVMLFLGGLAVTAYSVATEPPPHISVPLPTPAALPLTYPDQWVVYFSDQYRVPWRTAMALAESESGLRPDAVGSDGVSYGVMQLNSKYFVGSQLMSVAENVENGVKYLGLMILACNGNLKESAPAAFSRKNNLVIGESGAGFIDLGPVSYEGFMTVDQRGRISGCAVDRYRGKRR